VWPVLDTIYRLSDLPESEIIDPPTPIPPLQPSTPILSMQGVSFAYEPGAPVLQDVSFEVPSLSTIGVLGATGSGKSTLVDLLTGLLTPGQGVIEVHGEPLSNQNVRSWQQCIGYVPQEILLIDDTIAANIAYGIPPTEVDEQRLHVVARLAQIDTFIDQLPGGYTTRTGERGVQLSGGQRQRIGIARALYRDPEILVFDEATSALDSETETAFMEAVQSLKGSKTLFIIAHRLSTLNQCTNWLEVRDKQVIHHLTPPANVN